MDDLLVNEPAVTRGWLEFQTPANPAAGLPFSFTVGSRNIVALELVSVIATFSTDANVANRLVSLDYVNERSVTVIRNAAPVLVTNGTTNQVFQWARSRTVSEWNTGTPVFAPLEPVMLTPGWTVALNVDSIQVGDQLASITWCGRVFYADH